MAFQGFGKSSGPSFPPRGQTLFGNSPTSSDPAVNSSSPSATPLSQPSPAPQQEPRLGTPTSHFENRNSQVSKRIRSPASPFEGHHTPSKLHFSLAETPRSNASPPRMDNQMHSSASHANPLAHQVASTVSTPDGAHHVTLSPTKPVDYNALKRVRSPPLSYSDDILGIVTPLAEDDTERELHAKAKRLARFGVELSQPVQKLHDHKLSTEAKSSQSLVEKNVAMNGSGKESGELLDRSMINQEGNESLTAIVGLCQDMCPVPEREERERKGDLDQYERLDGDRNLTHISLAVKKYNRMAEREAHLIRPMPVLRKTMDYLLDLIDQPYNDNFLGMYNFLWDRMRAIRMDLRMQHIFNQDAIIMLEQMIRLHIIAMHELCEYKRGEGFSEGFDAHLNIEQMNKTSVELFQMYDDHRKKGINVTTEKEFRGYYALLKLDKHPGYRVEPAELSLDLAKMTPAIRGTPEILFARAVARACRTGNFIAFFRLAREATYLQACLMHAHFSKLRTQALASLHSGLQNNQGIPVSQVVKWLGMEGEDIEGLLEYHGYIIKAFEEPFAVKDGPFLNSDVDYSTKCSELVHLKKSKKIIDDVSSGHTISEANKRTTFCDFTDNFTTFETTVTPPMSEKRNKLVSKKIDICSVANMGDAFFPKTTETPIVSDVRQNFAPQERSTHLVETWTGAIDDEMQVPEDDLTPNDIKRPQLTVTEQSTSCPYSDKEHENTNVHQTLVFPVSRSSVTIFSAPSDVQVAESDECVNAYMNHTVPLVDEERPIQVEATEKLRSGFVDKTSTPQKEADDLKQNEALMMVTKAKCEYAMAKLKMIISTWKHQASRKREIREKRQLLADMAMSSLSLGPPVHQNETHPDRSGGKLNLDVVVKERNRRLGRSWSRLNIASLVGPILNTNNPKEKCLCWKLIVCLHGSDTELNNVTPTWLLSKLMGTRKEKDNELVFTSSNISIWKNVVGSHNTFEQSFCFSIIRNVAFEDKRENALKNATIGANAVVYLVSEGISWEDQRVHIRSLLMSVPAQSRLPLLILCGHACKEGFSDPPLIIKRLGLLDIDKTIISNISVISLTEKGLEGSFGGFLSDDNLREGLKWLADQSPLQPSLHLVKTRELVLNHLDSSMEALNKMKISEVVPDQCIMIFNEALDQSAEKIKNAANMNPNFWPCPEIDLIEEVSIDRQVKDTFLPSTGWSSSTKIEPIVDAIKSCKLPAFCYDVSSLSQGSYLGKEIPSHKSKLEEHIVNYLTWLTKMMSKELAVKEANLMLQRSAVLELHGLHYYLLPKWAAIFRRVYNWRLMKLTARYSASAYILADDLQLLAEPPHSIGFSAPMNCSFEVRNSVNSLGFTGDKQMHLSSAEPSLDEMIYVGCSFAPSQQTISVASPQTNTDIFGSECIPGPSEDGQNLEFSGSSGSIDAILSAEKIKGAVTLPLTSDTGSDKLRMLLEQCKKLQDVIDKKLSIYF